jgi:diadenosine tetraphosphatase ApaH/serine/threonine PP2A family protein phosphatase
MEYLRSLPFVMTDRGVTLVHATMDSPEGFGYVFDHLQAEAHFVHQKTPLCFHGHTHCPMIYEKQMGAVYRIDAQDFTLHAGRKYFINVGSVGQPRDENPRACVVYYDYETRDIKLSRVEYDVQSTMKKILKSPLAERFAKRLEVGR